MYHRIMALESFSTTVFAGIDDETFTAGALSRHIGCITNLTSRYVMKKFLNHKAHQGSKRDTKIDCEK
jgi:hypothetical protein